MKDEFLTAHCLIFSGTVRNPKKAEYGNGDTVFSVTATDQSGNVSNVTDIVDLVMTVIAMAKKIAVTVQ